jgi:hypothetical protein
VGFYRRRREPSVVCITIATAGEPNRRFTVASCRGSRPAAAMAKRSAAR